MSGPSGRRVAAVLLAAGRSTRFTSSSGEGSSGEGDDRPKQLIDWQGQPLVRHMARRLLLSRSTRVVVVVGHRARQVSQALDGLDLEIVNNPDFVDGQSTSLRTGLRAVRDTADAVLFVPCDQPHLSVGTLDRMIAAAEQHPHSLIQARYPTHRGAPTLFPKDFFPHIEHLTGDTGGRQILRLNADRLQSVDIGNALEGEDVDTPADLHRVREQQRLTSTGHTT